MQLSGDVRISSARFPSNRRSRGRGNTNFSGWQHQTTAEHNFDPYDNDWMKERCSGAICHSWALRRYCRYGEECWYSHELTTPNYNNNNNNNNNNNQLKPLLSPTPASGPPPSQTQHMFMIPPSPVMFMPRSIFNFSTPINRSSSNGMAPPPSPIYYTVPPPFAQRNVFPFSSTPAPSHFHSLPPTPPSLTPKNSEGRLPVFLEICQRKLIVDAAQAWA